MSDLIVYNNPSEQFQNVDVLVELMHKRAKHLILDIRGKSYPTVNYYTALLWACGLTAREESVSKVSTDDGSTEYEACISVRRVSDGTEITRGSAIASSNEQAPWARQAFSIRSMAITRAVGKTCRLYLSVIPIMARIESCSAEEMSELPALPAPERKNDHGFTLPNSVPTGKAAAITERFSAARLDEELDSLALELCGIAEQLGHKTTAVKCRAQCTKGAASGSEVKERLLAKIKAGTEKLITTKEGTK
jgi:hypothetical protein